MSDGPDYKPTPVAGMPAQPTTVQLPAVPPWAIELTRSVKDGFQGVNARLDSVETNLDLQGAQGVDLGKRMTAIETRVGNIEARQDSGSLRVKQESEVNLKQDAALGLIAADVSIVKGDVETIKTDLAKNSATTAEVLDKVTDAAAGFLRAHPAIVVGIVGFIMTAIQVATTWVAAKGH